MTATPGNVAARSSLRARLCRLPREEGGAVAIEFVLIAPILLALVFGTVTVGYVMGLTHSVHQLATGAARASVAGLDAEERAQLARDFLSAGSTRYPLLMQANVQPTVTVESLSPPGITVQIDYGLDGSLLQIANGFLGLDIQTIQRSAYLAY